MDLGMQCAIEIKHLCEHKHEEEPCIMQIDEESQEVRAMPLKLFVSDPNALHALTLLIRASNALSDVYLEQNAELRTIKKRVRQVNEAFAALNFATGPVEVCKKSA